MKQLLLVGLGGAIGAVLRWQIGGAILHHTASWRFPVGTLAVNVIGCVVAGLVTGLVLKSDALSPDARLFIFTGLLGGFTTFSAFGVEAVALLRRGEFALAMLYVLVSVVAGLLGLWAGIRAVHGKA